MNAVDVVGFGHDFNNTKLIKRDCAMLEVSDQIKLHYNRLMTTTCTLYCTHYLLRLTKMDAITYTTARQNLAQTMNRVCVDHDPIIITRNNQQSVVMMSLEDYNALQETAYLLRHPKNAQRLLASIAQLESGQGQVRELLE